MEKKVTDKKKQTTKNYPYMKKKVFERRDTTIKTTTHQTNPNKKAHDAKRTITTTKASFERKKK